MLSVTENSVNLDAVIFGAFYLAKLVFGKYFCYFDANRVADLLQLHLQLDAIHVPVRERANNITVLGISQSSLESDFSMWKRSIIYSHCWCQYSKHLRKNPGMLGITGLVLVSWPLLAGISTVTRHQRM